MQIRIALLGCVFLGLSLLQGIPSSASELKPKTIAAFDVYVQAAETRMDNELRSENPFLWVDSLPEPKRRELYEELRKGELEVDQQHSEAGHSAQAPDGLIHDWVGIAFVPGVTLQRAVSVLQDYDHHAITYKPSVRRSKLLSHDDDHFRIYLQFYRETSARVSFNTEFSVTYRMFDNTRAESRSISTRVAELKDPGNPDSPEFPVGTGRGYLWRMNNYWRLEEKDGGTYIQVETIALSRGVPTFFGWFVNPIIRRVSRETLADSLNAARKAMQAASTTATHSAL